MSGGRVGDMARGEGSPEAAAAPGVDLYSQARKALSLRSPFDGKEVASRDATLPARLARWAGLRDGRKRHKKAQPSEAAPAGPAAAPAASAGMWEPLEPYFRQITMDDIDALALKLKFCSSRLDSCLLMPFVGSRKELMEKFDAFDVVEADKSSNLDGGSGELDCNREQGMHEVVVQQEERLWVAAEKRSNLGGGGEVLYSNKEQDMHEVVVQQDERLWKVEREQGGSSCIVLPEHGEGADASLNWLLEAKDRFVLTSERPNKKRKLLGADAGLEQLLLLPHWKAEAAGSICDFCCMAESSTRSNRMLRCYSCKMSVHPKCYGVHVVPDGQWLCVRCKHLESTGELWKRDVGNTLSLPCVLCPKERGALKPIKREAGRTADGVNLEFVHLFCSLWVPEFLVEDIESMEPVTITGDRQENQKKLVCNLCKVKHGICIRCSHGTCRTSFHPICARELKYQMEIWGKSGHNNVEMRAFCAKHSTVGGINSVEKSNNVVKQDSAEVRQKDANLVTANIPKLKYTRRNKDKCRNYEATSCSSGCLIKVETVELDTLPSTVRSVDGQAIQSTEMDIDCSSGGGNLMRNSGDVAVVLRKLIDQGNVCVGDIASEVGISSESLEAALVGETTTFSPGLKLKIIKCLQNSVHRRAVQVKTLKGCSVVLPDNKLDSIQCTNTINVKSPLVPGDDKGAAVYMPHSLVTKSSPPRKARGSGGILKDNEAICVTGVSSLQNGNKKIFKEAANGGCFPGEVIKQGTNRNLSSSSSKDSLKGAEHKKMILNSASGDIKSDTSLQIQNGSEGTSLIRESNDLTEAQVSSDLEEGTSSLDHCFSQGHNAKDGASSVENGFCSHHDCDVTDQPFFIFDGSHSYVHPLIKKKLAHLWEHTFKQNKWATFFHDESSCPSHDQKHVDLSMELEHSTDTAAADQVSKAKALGILEHSPDDEVEGEIVYLQARLLSNAVAMKQRYEDLILKIVQNISLELDAFNKRKWGLILANQFLHDTREDKKRGRKENRHKQAQATLAAAAAAIAASPRNATMRKDADINVVSANRECPPKLSTGSSRVVQPTSLSQTKDSSRLPNNKDSQDIGFGIFDVQNFSKDHALYCDVCTRSETVLNRIFVCSSCKQAAVHLTCYQRLKNPTGPWKCELCEELSSQAAITSNPSDCNGINSCLAQCGLCCGISGAFRKTTGGQWVHAFCAEWLLEDKFTRGQDNPVGGMDCLLREKYTCSICLRNAGACLKCSSGDCHVTFHPSCARGAGLYMNAKGFGGMLQHKAYCGRHSIEQREVDRKQFGPEELKSMKQMRVELEKLRFLCDRIIKREKLKRDLAVCMHGILATKKNCIALSRWSSYYAPGAGASSESATTSINNKSYSETMQRSDDITVDSNVSKRQAVRFSLHNRDSDRNTADSSTTSLSSKRKLDDRESIAGKQLPQRPAAALQKSEDGEKKPKNKKHIETFQKELAMSSDQASMQNQRLPKGYVYVPRDSLSKEKTWNHNIRTHEREEPGG